MGVSPDASDPRIEPYAGFAGLVPGCVCWPEFSLNTKGRRNEGQEEERDWIHAKKNRIGLDWIDI